MGYSPWGRTESDTTERLSTHAQAQTRMLLVLLCVFFLFLETRDPGQCNCNITNLRIP